MNTVVSQMVEMELENTAIKTVVVTDDSLDVDLMDGRTISTPIVWYPRLLNATPAEIQNFHVFGNAIHWPDLDEDVSVRSMLLGRKSGESSRSLQRWLDQREAQKRTQASTPAQQTA